MKKVIKRIIPRPLLTIARSPFVILTFVWAYIYDFKRYFKYSSTLRYDNSRFKLSSSIVRNYHVVEKGLTMPQTKLGFGAERLLLLIHQCQIFISQFGNDDSQLAHAVGVITEYKHFHEENAYQLDQRLLNAIDNLVNNYEREVLITQQRVASKEAYFEYSQSSFDFFSNSRASIRNYSEQNVPLELIKKSIELARNTPSACNRQTSRAYIYKEKNIITEILNVQGGNRGFGHLANSLIILTADLGCFANDSERNQAFVDGGMYAMNVLYSLHFNGIAACILNCSNTPKKDQKLRQLSKIKESEVFIAMISCGYPPQEFKIATSKRYELQEICAVID